MRQQIQQFGRTLSGMVMPNIGAFIAWGFITALFIPEGWWPNGQLAQLVGPMLTYLLPLLIAYTAGRNVAGERGGVIGAIAAVGVIVGSDIPMFIGAMIMGPLAGYAIRRFDRMVEGHVKAGFEMLVSNFSIGILGMLLAVLGYYVVGSVVTGLTMLISSGAELVIRHGLLPLVSLFVEPAKVLFLNNAVNHGIFSPIGIEQARETGQSIMFLLETNPGPGLGVLLAYWLFGRGNARQSAPGAVIIQFFGGIHEIYFPYILARPVLIVAAIAGSVAGLLFFSLSMHDVFRTQLRALLRASVFGNLRIMFPMITSVGEFRRAEAAVRECMAELDAEKAAYNPGIELGVMIETPAAVMVADLLAAEARFFSIGTNDLTQYVMAADRGNPRVAHLCDPFDTAVRRSVAMTLAAARSAGIEAGMCGELAADPEATAWLLEAGLEEFSVSAPAVAPLKERIRTLDLPEVRKTPGAAE